MKCSSFTEFHRALPSFIWLCRVFTEFYWVLLNFTGVFRVLSSFTKFYRVLFGFTGLYRVLSSFTVYLPSFTGFDWAVSGFYRVFCSRADVVPGWYLWLCRRTRRGFGECLPSFTEFPQRAVTRSAVCPSRTNIFDAPMKSEGETKHGRSDGSLRRDWLWKKEQFAAEWLDGVTSFRFVMKRKPVEVLVFAGFFLLGNTRTAAGVT